MRKDVTDYEHNSKVRINLDNLFISTILTIELDIIKFKLLIQLINYRSASIDI